MSASGNAENRRGYFGTLLCRLFNALLLLALLHCILEAVQLSMQARQHKILKSRHEQVVGGFKSLEGPVMAFINDLRAVSKKNGDKNAASILRNYGLESQEPPQP